tara:strand:- start:1663 stop:2361 length:699 start_codon:yes stop_codon:yes gene_type:complete
MISAIIPARGGSKSIPRKNLVPVHGHPLIAYSIALCKAAKNIDRVFVSTEDKEIARIAKEYGAEVPFLRPEELSTDTASDVGFLNHFFDNYNFEEIALIRPTTPMRNENFVDKVIQIYFNNKENLTGLRTMHEINESPYKLFKISDNFCESFFGDIELSNMPRQSFPKTYKPDGHIDIVKQDTVRKGNTFGNKIFAVKGEKIVDIDSKEDLDVLLCTSKTIPSGWVKHLKRS